MPGARIIVNTKELQALFARLGQFLKNPRPALEALRNRLFEETKEAFNRQRSPEGTPWPSLNRAYAQRKLRLFGPRKKLVARGFLARSIISGLLEGNRGVFVGSPLEYAARHQFGFSGAESVSAHRRKVKSRDVRIGRRIGARGVGFVSAFTRQGFTPARPFLPSAATAEKLGVEVLEDALEQAVGEGR